MIEGFFSRFPPNLFDPTLEPLHVCILNDDVPQLQLLLGASPVPDINYSHQKYGPPLHFAIWCDNLDAVDLLLAAGANSHIVSYGQRRLTAIGLAASKGHRDIVKRLWARCAPESHLDGLNIHETCLVMAASHGQASVVDDMLNWWNGWSQDSKIEALWYAAKQWQFGVVNLLLKRESFEQPMLQDALHSAANHKVMITDGIPKYEGVEYANQQLLIASLIDAGADPNSSAYSNIPLLFTVACNSNLTGALKTLLEKGADPNKTNESGLSALHVLTEPVEVRQMGGGPFIINETAIRLLLQYKASVSQPDSAGECPIHWASYGFNLRLFHIYLYSHLGPDRDNLLRLTNNNEETLLHFAAAGCRTEVMEYLLYQGLDVNATNSNGWTPLMCALTPIDRSTCWTTNVKTLAEAIESAHLLLSYGADPNIVTDEGWTPLHVLALYLDVAGKAEEFAKDLIARGADPEARAPLPATVGPYVSWGMPWGYRLRGVMADPPAKKWIVRSNMMPLQWAAERGAVGVTKALLSSGVDVPAMDVDGASVDVDGTPPAEMAAKSKFLEGKPDLVKDIINLLIDARAGL
ncbi:hypothetical protein V498_02391 [Pseudogymnoascus sp. VKM F-4517 (FW-2822)]|nr:hypothetical protein V498_02391 [Pseudogymnoascus sp. VKM F-4517 (FW-2822)]